LPEAFADNIMAVAAQVSSKGRFVIGCDIIEADKLSNRLVSLLPRQIDLRTANALRLGLRELLINAVEHGCLEIGFDLKTEISESKDYLEFLLERQKQPEYRTRKVQVEYDIRAARIVFRITDDGKGFDHKERTERARGEAELPDLAHGRGIKMSLRIFDRVRYNSRGNSVTVAKKLPN
jgi:anti-sigma regulatory factor (Ser/Thr protein kinase)